MYLEKLKKRLEILNQEKEDILKKSQESDDVEEVKALEEELKQKKEQIVELEQEIKDLESTDDERNDDSDIDGQDKEDVKKDEESENRSANPVSSSRQPQLRKVSSYGFGEKKGDNMDKELEKRAAEFAQSKTLKYNTAEARALLISGGKIATPTKVSGINDTFNEVSSIVDMVVVEDCEGMGSDKVAYKKSSGKATKKTEGSKNTDASGMVVDYVEITPSTLSTYDEISREVMKQSPLKYQSKVAESAKISLRAAAAAKIINAVATAKAIDADGKLEISAIDQNTLRKIALSYGGSLSIPGETVLLLTKEDLIAFGDVRGTNEKRAVYEITPDTSNTNTGIIKDGGLSVKYCLDNNLTPLSKAKLTEGELPSMMYGNPKTIKLDLFGDYNVRSSEDYKFAEGLIAVMGEVMCGCDVVYYNGFTLVSKKSSSTGSSNQG